VLSAAAPAAQAAKPVSHAKAKAHVTQKRPAAKRSHRNRKARH